MPEDITEKLRIPVFEVFWIFLKCGSYYESFWNCRKKSMSNTFEASVFENSWFTQNGNQKFWSHRAQNIVRRPFCHSVKFGLAEKVTKAFPTFRKRFVS